MRSRAASILLLAFAPALACGPGQASEVGDAADEAETGADDSGDSTGATGSGSDDATGESSDSSTSDSSTSDSSTSDSSDTSSESAETGASCPPGYLACPDESCQLEHFNNPYDCCGHGGECLAGCEPQDAASTMDSCPDPAYAWTGDGCEEVCACEGGDCASLYASLDACYSDREPDCGFLGYDSCPFDLVFGPTQVSGLTPIGEQTFSYGAFGQVFGKGSGTDLSIRLAADPVVFGNYLWKLYDYPEAPTVLTIFGGSASEPGVYMVSVSLVTAFPESVPGTLTIESIDVDGPGGQEHSLVATLEVVDADWDLSGSFAIHGCQKLDLYLP